jgi:hypothetical protein
VTDKIDPKKETYDKQQALRDLTSIIWKDAEFYRKFQDAGQWRGLFDCYSSEWRKSGIEQKISILHGIMQRSGWTFNKVCLSYEDYWRGERDDIVSAGRDAAREMLGWILSSESVLP